MGSETAARRRTVLLAAAPESVAAAAAVAVRPHTLLSLRTLPTIDSLRALHTVPDLILLGEGAGSDPMDTLLSQLKPDPAWRQVPVLVGAAEWSGARLLELYKLQANACLSWPTPETAEAWTASLLRFWLSGEALLALPAA